MQQARHFKDEIHNSPIKLAMCPNQVCIYESKSEDQIDFFSRTEDQIDFKGRMFDDHKTFVIVAVTNTVWKP